MVDDDYTKRSPIEETLWVLRKKTWKEKHVILKPLEVGGKTLGCNCTLEIRSLKKTKKSKITDLGPGEHYCIFLEKYVQKTCVLAILPFQKSQQRIFLHANETVLKQWFTALTDLLQVSSFDVNIPSKQKFPAGSAVIHVYATKFCLTLDTPPKFSVLGTWEIDSYANRCSLIQGGIQLRSSTSDITILRCDRAYELLQCLRCKLQQSFMKSHRGAGRNRSTSTNTLSSELLCVSHSPIKGRTLSVPDLNFISKTSPRFSSSNPFCHEQLHLSPNLPLKASYAAPNIPPRVYPPIIPDRSSKHTSSSSSSLSSCSSLEKTLPVPTSFSSGVVNERLSSPVPSPTAIHKVDSCSSNSTQSRLNSNSSVESNIIENEHTHQYVHCDTGTGFQVHTDDKECKGCKCHDDTNDHAYTSKTWYYNLPDRPRRYIYMNTPDLSTQPMVSSSYTNIFMPDSRYVNWKTLYNDSLEGLPSDLTPDIPPDIPPRPLVPRVPPPKRPCRNGPTRSVSVVTAPTPQPPRPPKLKTVGKSKSCVSSEGLPMRVAVFASEPIHNFFWILRVALWHKEEDDVMYEKISSYEKCCKHQPVKPPTPFEAVGNVRIAVDKVMDGWELFSEKEQIIPFDDLCHVQFQWIVLEFHFAPSQLSQFSATIVAEPEVFPSDASSKSSLIRNSLGIFQKFQPKKSECLNCGNCQEPSYLPLDMKHRKDLMILLDSDDSEGNNWIMLGVNLLNLEQPEIDFIKSKNSMSFSPTLHILRTWETLQKENCSLDRLRDVLYDMQRLDALNIVQQQKQMRAESESTTC